VLEFWNWKISGTEEMSGGMLVSTYIRY